MDQSPPYVLRSVSLKNVINDDINLQPQNYCVVGGQTVRIRRSQEERRIDEQDIQAKLTHYEGLVRSQKLEMEYQNERIGQLEDLLRHLNIEEAIIQRPLLYPQLKNKELRESLMGKNLFDLHRPEGIQVQRERSTTSDETDADSVFPSSFSVYSTDYVTPKAQPDDNNKFFPTPTHSGSPSSLLDENNSNHNTDNDNAVVIAPLTSKTCPLESTSSPDLSALQLRLSSSISERRKALSSLCGSRSKFGSFRTNKKLASNTASSASPSPLTVVNDENVVNNNNNNNTLQQESGVPLPQQELPFSSSAAHLVKFHWKEKQEPCLFIYHDNPQLHNNINQFLESNSYHQMHIMIESHQTKEKAKFLFGFIVFSGSFHEIENANPQDVRGGLCLAVKGLYGVSGNMKSSFMKRNKSNHSDIVEVELMNPQQRKGGGEQQSEGQQYYEIKKPMDLELFFSGCCSRVDVILDPYHDDFHWYPYFEGTRKMAPQFRSKGIGYLRLGDDMSNYGTAFLSVDGGRCYLDNGATNITGKTITGNNNNQDDDCSTVVSWKSDKSTQSHKKKSRGGLTDTIRKLIHTSREGSVDGTNPYVFNNNSSSSGNEEETAIRSQFQEIVLQLAQDNKWTEKVKLIQRFIANLEKKKTGVSAFLTSILENNNNNNNSGNGIAFFSFCRCLSDHLSKNMINPKLLAELLKTIEFLVESSSLSLTSSSQDPFFMALLSSFSATAIEGKGIRSFLADVIKLLKNSYTPVIQEKIQKLLFLIFPIHSHLSLNGLADILSEIFPSQSSSVPPSYSKICSFINQFLSQFYRITDGISLNSTVFSSFSSVFLQMIQHRDEGIREFSLQILAMIILLRRIAIGEEDEEESAKKGRLAAILLLQKNSSNSGSEEFLQLLSAYQLDTLFNYLKAATSSNKSGEKLMAICAKNLNERQLRSRSSGRSAIRTPGSSSSSRQQKGKAPLKRTLSGKQQSQKKENNNNNNNNNNNSNETEKQEDKNITDSLLRLSNFWFECKLLFKTVPSNEMSWKQAFQVFLVALLFLSFL
jgi:hypothetical protein